MFKSHIERVIRNYLNSPSFGSPPDVSNQQHNLFNVNHHHLSVRKITNGFLMAYNDGNEIIYCANEKDLADQIIARAARSKVHGDAEAKASRAGASIAAPSTKSNSYNNIIAGKL